MSAEQQRPALVIVRDPFSWYISWWRTVHGEWREGRQSHGQVPGHGDWQHLPFEQALPLMESCQSWLARLTANAERVVVGRFEQLRAEVLRVLAEVAGDVPAELRRRILHSPAQHATAANAKHLHYTAAMSDLVMERNAVYIQRFGYARPASG
jgi:hypothetical protein